MSTLLNPVLSLLFQFQYSFYSLWFFLFFNLHSLSSEDCPFFIFKYVLFHLYFIIDYDLITLTIYMILHIQTHSLHSKTKQITLQQSIPLHKSHRKQMAHGRPSRTIINPRDHSYPCGQFHGWFISDIWLTIYEFHLQISILIPSPSVSSSDSCQS